MLWNKMLLEKQNAKLQMKLGKDVKVGGYKKPANEVG